MSIRKYFEFVPKFCFLFISKDENMLHMQKKELSVFRAVFSSLFCVHTQTLSNGIGSNYRRYKEIVYNVWDTVEHKCEVMPAMPKLKFQNDDKYLNGSSYRLCAANNHSKSIMTVIKTAHKHQNFSMCMRVAEWLKPVKNNNKTNAFRLMKRVHICEANVYC